MNNKVYVIWDESGSYEDRYTCIYKIYANEYLAKLECDKLNQQLKSDKERYEHILDIGECTCEELDDVDDECEYCEADSGYYRLQEQWDYRVEEFEVEQ